MPANYKGKFCGLDGKWYEVRIIGDGSSEEYTEIMLAGSNPFTVQYNASSTPFEPVRTSTAQINVVHSTYMEDILSAEAQATRIDFVDVTDSANTITVWTGFLTPKILNAPYRDEYETYQLEAADCINSLQYIDYTLTNSGGVVSFLEQISQMCDACQNLDGFIWTASKKVGSTTLLPEHVYVSEHNWLYSDTLEPLKLMGILEETCRYFGFTALQWGRYMYFIDYQYLSENDAIAAVRYTKDGGYQGASETLDGPFTVSGDTYRADDANISFEPVYNKVEVRANMYAADMFIPNIMDDSLLTNRNGEFYANLPVATIHEVGRYFNGSFLGIEDYNWETKDHRDTDYIFRHRYYDHKYWESVYTRIDNAQPATPGSASATTAITMSYRGATITDMGRVEKNHYNENQQLIVPSKMDYTRYLCIRTGDNNNRVGTDEVVFRLKPNYSGSFIGMGTEFLVINFTCLWEKYGDRNYINPEWTDKTVGYKSSGTRVRRIGHLRFRLGIGGKWWNGQQWGDSPAIFEVEAEWDKERKGWRGPDCWNTDLSVLNNVSWEEELNVSGYKIPLSGVDLTQEITFEIVNPSACVGGNTGNPNFTDYNYEYNAYMWVKNLTFDLVRKQHEDKKENDVVYSNVISSGSVCDLGTITCKLTTDTELAQPSYSTVGYAVGDDPIVALSSVTEEAITGTVQKPEDNIVEKYVLQYQTPTSKIVLTQPVDIAPFQVMYGVDVADQEQRYVELGTEIDYLMGRQTITAVEKK